MLYKKVFAYTLSMFQIRLRKFIEAGWKMGEIRFTRIDGVTRYTCMIAKGF